MNTLMLRRRLTYISAMVLLLVPLYFLGKPSVRRTDGSVMDQGGALAQLRTRYDLGQSDLGEMDPASESMRLATLGLRGVAATILWQYAEYYKREQYWDRLSATLNQIAVLQPHFVKVWEFQAHNLSYNVSVEFDDYRQRYEWVKRGMNYLVMGSKYNKRRTEMPFELGWFFGNKFGVADEKVQFRELFRNDRDFHQEMLDKSGVDFTQRAARGPDGKPDNWLVGALWYQKAYDMVDAGCRPARSALMFWQKGPQWQMKYAEGIQTEGVLDYAARDAWERAGEAWNEFGQMQIDTTFGDTIFLNEIEIANQEYARLKEEFAEFCGETYDRMIERRRESMGKAQLAAYDKDDVERTFDELVLARQAEYALELNPSEIAKQTPEDIRVDAIRMASAVEVAKERIRHIETYRDQINYGYWAIRCEAEQQESTMLARTSMYEADQLLDRGELDAALEKYEVAWQEWNKLFNAYPAMMIDDVADEIVKSIERYRRLLDVPELPDDFALSKFKKFRELYETDLADQAMMSVISAWPTRYPGRDFLEEMLRKSLSVSAEELERRKASDVDPPIPGAPVTSDPAAASQSEAKAEEKPQDTEGASPNDGAEPDVPAELSAEQPDEGAAPAPAVNAPGSPAVEPTSDAQAAGADAPTAGSESTTEEEFTAETPDEGTAPVPVARP